MKSRIYYLLTWSRFFATPACSLSLSFILTCHNDETQGRSLLINLLVLCERASKQYSQGNDRMHYYVADNLWELAGQKYWLIIRTHNIVIDLSNFRFYVGWKKSKPKQCNTSEKMAYSWFQSHFLIEYKIFNCVLFIFDSLRTPVWMNCWRKRVRPYSTSWNFNRCSTKYKKKTLGILMLFVSEITPRKLPPTKL